MNTAAHPTCTPAPRSDRPLMAVFYLLMIVAIGFAVLRGTWPPDETRLRGGAGSGMTSVQ